MPINGFLVPALASSTQPRLAKANIESVILQGSMNYAVMQRYAHDDRHRERDAQQHAHARVENKLLRASARARAGAAVQGRSDPHRHRRLEEVVGRRKELPGAGRVAAISRERARCI